MSTWRSFVVVVVVVVLVVLVAAGGCGGGGGGTCWGATTVPMHSLQGMLQGIHSRCRLGRPLLLLLLLSTTFDVLRCTLEPTYEYLLVPPLLCLRCVIRSR